MGTSPAVTDKASARPAIGASALGGVAAEPQPPDMKVACPDRLWHPQRFLQSDLTL